jgi:HEAT repeat protein
MATTSKKRLIALGAALVTMLVLALKPNVLVAAWQGIVGLIEVRGEPVAASPAVISEHEIAELEGMEPQVQADRLLERAINHYDGATELIAAKVDAWNGKIRMDPSLNERFVTAMNSNDLRVRAAGIEIYLAAYRASKTPRGVDWLMKKADEDPKGRPTYIFALGMLGNRGVEQTRVLDYLLRYVSDPDLDTRHWAVEGLAVLGTDDTIVPLLKVFHDDPSGFIRERAACGLAQSGMFTQAQRWTAIPELIRFSDDPALDAQTQSWAFQALRDISGERLDSNATAWREWWATNPRPGGSHGPVAIAEIPAERIKPAAPLLDAPQLVAPAEGEHIDRFPRTLKLDWVAVAGASTYTVQVDCLGCCKKDAWCEDVGRSYVYETKIRDHEFDFEFAGMQRGRWRCWAVDAEGRMGRKSEWREFVFVR